jgi:hypothetical protein
MIARGLAAAAIVVFSVAALAAEESRSPPPPTLLSPADDGNLVNCLRPDPQHGVKLDWRRGEASGLDDLALTNYLEIRRVGSHGEWAPWLKRFVKIPPFYLNATSDRVYDATFAWRVWTVDRSGTLKPYATASGWWLFCTTPRNADGKEPPADSKAPPAEEGAAPPKGSDE